MSVNDASIIAATKMFSNVYSEAAASLGMTPASYWRRARLLKVIKDYDWTVDEVAKLVAFYKADGPRDLLSVPSLRPMMEIACMAFALGMVTEEKPFVLKAKSKKRKGTKKGKRADLGDMAFRSAWEANYARYLNVLIKQGKITKWEYEQQVFDFPFKKGTRSYLPDFKLWLPDGTYFFIEVKGKFDPQAKVKMKRMKKYYPNIIVKMVMQKQMRVLDKMYRDKLPHWEPM